MERRNVSDRLAPFAGGVAAVVWAVGFFFSGFASPLGTLDSFFYFSGITTALVGLLLIPLVLALWRPMSQPRVLLNLGGIGIVIALISTGLLLIAGATGKLGDRAPNIIPVVWSAALGLFFIWILVTSFTWRGELGAAPLWLGIVLAIAAILIAIGIPIPEIASNRLVNLSFIGYLVLFILLPAGTVWLAIPGWLITTGMRLWSRHGDLGNGRLPPYGQSQAPQSHHG
jgi:hypothetical protein